MMVFLNPIPSFRRGRFQMHENVCILIQIFKFLQGDPNGTKSELVQPNCSKHCLNHCWSWFIMPHGINMPQWLKYEGLNGIFKYMFAVQKFYMLNDISLNFVSKGLFGCTWTWVSLMDWHHADGKPLLITRPGCVLVMAVWWHTSGSNSTLAQVMAWCRQAPSHCLNQSSPSHLWGSVAFTWDRFHNWPSYSSPCSL